MTGIDWIKLARRLQEVQAQMIHHDEVNRYGDEFYAEALRRTLGYREPHGHITHETVSESTGLMTTAHADHLIEGYTVLSRLHAEDMERQAKAAREETRRILQDAARDLAKWIREWCNDRTVSAKTRRQGVLIAANWIDPDLRDNCHDYQVPEA